MKVLIGKFTLAGGGRESVQDFRFSGSPVIQEMEFFRAPFINFKERGLVRRVISFGVTRQHKDVAAAEVYLLEHDGLVPKQGLVEFVAEGNKARRWMQAAVIAAVNSSYLGATTRHEYEMHGGELLARNPNLQ